MRNRARNVSRGGALCFPAVAGVVAKKLAQDGSELGPRHALFLDKIPADGLMPRTLQAENLRHLIGGQQPQPPCRLPGLFVASL
jgi:hypothetical protein